MQKLQDEWVPTVCYMCYGACGIKARRVNGVVVEVKGDPNNPHNLGKMCAKGKAGIIGLYDPYRARRPLKRTNPEKGVGIDPKWKEISWDEALDEIAERLRKIREEDPRKLVLAGLDFQLSPIAIYRAFASAFGTANIWSGASGYFCGNGLHPVLYSTHGTFYAEPDYDRCDYCLNVGSQMGFMVNTNATNLAGKVAEARSRGMRVVVIDPVLSNAATKADEWVPIRPGTDAAFVLGLINILLNDLGAYDSFFLQSYTNGPYLIAADGRYLREVSTQRPLVWDLRDNSAKAYNAADLSQLAIEGRYNVSGQEAAPAFQLLKEHVRGYAPEMVAKVTTVPAETVVRIAREFAHAARIGSTIVIDGQELPLRPVAANWNRGAVAHKHGMLTGIAIQLLNILVGAIDVPGGLLGTNPVGPFWQPKEGPDGLMSPADIQMSAPALHPVGEIKPPVSLQLRELFPVASYSRPFFEEAVLNPGLYSLPYSAEVFITSQSNCMISASHPGRMEQVLKKIPFIVSFALQMDETVQFADIVLPDAHYLERLVPFPNRLNEFLAPGEGSWYWPLAQPVKEPAGSARPWPEVLLEIADRVGISSDLVVMWNSIHDLKAPFQLDPEKRYSWSEVADIWAKSWFGPEHDLNWFKEHGFLIWAKKKVHEAYPRPFLKLKIPIYYEHFIKAGQDVKEVTDKLGLAWDISDYQPLPDWKPCPDYPPASPDTIGGRAGNASRPDLYAVNYKLPFHTFSNTTENPWLDELAQHHPYAYKVLIHTQAAAERALKEGDTVWVESAAGRVKGELKVTEGLHPEVAAIAGTFGHWAPGMPIAQGKGLHFNSLLPHALERIDAVSAAIDCCVRVKVYKV